jgi:GR25 family glycosyltransferase involved in LPS biosynthesis
MSTPRTGNLRFDELPITVVSLGRAADRRRRLAEQLELLGVAGNVRWFDAIEGESIDEEQLRAFLSETGYALYREQPQRSFRGSMTAGALACALSWKGVLEDVKVPTLVLEDDAIFDEKFLYRFRAAWRRLPPDWDLVYLSWNTYMDPIGTVLDECVVRLERRLHGTGALLLSPKAASRIIALFPLDRQLDHDIPDRLIIPGLLNAYLLTYGHTPLIVNDNLGGSYTQYGTEPRHRKDS